jgi:flagellar motor switch protein FliN
MTDIPDAFPHQPASEARAEARPELRNWCEAWKSCFQNVLTQVAGRPHIFEISSQPLSAAESDVWYTVVAAGAAHGEMTLRLPAASGTRLAQKFLGESEPAAIGVTTETVPVENITAENKEALEELLRQIAGLAATALAVTAGGEVQLHLSASTAPAWSSDAIFGLQTGLQTTNDADAGTPAARETISLEIQISPALAATLLPRIQPEPPAQGSTSTSPAPASSYRRLMDVGLDVKLRFGTRRMLLRDILALSAGVVVELDNHLHSPVDLLLDGRLIAQGEVVVVDGKYGLRITDVVDPGTAAGAAG